MRSTKRDAVSKKKRKERRQREMLRVVGLKGCHMWNRSRCQSEEGTGREREGWSRFTYCIKVK